MLSSLCSVTRMRTGRTVLSPWSNIISHSLHCFSSHSTVFSYCHCIHGRGKSYSFIENGCVWVWSVARGIENRCVCWRFYGANKARDINATLTKRGNIRESIAFFLYIMPVRHIDVIRLSLYPLMDESYRWVYFCISSLSVVPPACFQNSPFLLHTSAKWQKIFFPSPVSSCIMLIDHSQSSFDRTLLFLEFSIPPATHAFPLAWQCI